jgi:phosphatidate phosphatase APP1
VWLFDNTAYRAESEHPTSPPWHAEVVACVFTSPREDIDIGKHVAEVADAIGLDGKMGTDPEIEARIVARLQPFLYAVVPHHSMVLEVPVTPSNTSIIQRLSLAPTDQDGMSQKTVVAIPQTVQEGTVLHPFVAGLAQQKGLASMETRLVGPQGWLVISDIDDSIKYTHTSEWSGILRTTFVEEPRPIAGMPACYAHVHQQLNPAWVYLSASPYNLYPFLRQFLRSFYHPGTLMLRETSWKDLSSLEKLWTEGIHAYKQGRMDQIHRWLPKRKVLCVGDSTQSDPEAYGMIYRKYPGWIKAIFIRRVTDIPHMEQKNLDVRFQTAFRDVPQDVWKVFDDPEELYALIDSLKQKGSIE